MCQTQSQLWASLEWFLFVGAVNLKSSYPKDAIWIKNPWPCTCFSVAKKIMRVMLLICNKTSNNCSLIWVPGEVILVNIVQVKNPWAFIWFPIGRTVELCLSCYWDSLGKHSIGKKKLFITLAFEVIPQWYFAFQSTDYLVKITNKENRQLLMIQK